MKKVCFARLGNVCRSPMAELVMKGLVGTEGRLIESCTASGWEHDNLIHYETQSTFKKHNVSYDKRRSSQQIPRKDFYDFDVIIGMDTENVVDLRHMSQGKYDDKIFLFIEGGVPDPWFTGDFGATYDLAKRGCEQ